MKKEMAKLLQVRADEVAAMFSKPRGGNVANETFAVCKITILSECTAAITYLKDPTKKKAVAWFYFINSRAKPRWEYFFVTYQHLVGLEHVAGLLHEVEQENYERSIEPR